MNCQQAMYLAIFLLVLSIAADVLDRWGKRLKAVRVADSLTAAELLSDIFGALDFVPDADYSVADMANVGRALMRTIKHAAPDWAPLQCPSEIVLDMINERDDARQRVQFLEEDMLSAAELAALIEVFAACSSARIGSARRDEVLRKLNRRALKVVQG